MKHLYLLYSFLFIPVFLSANPRALEYIENKGQWDGPFKYKVITGKGDVFLQTDGFTYVVGEPSNADEMDAYRHGIITQPPVLKFHAYKMTFVGANTPIIKGDKKGETYYNYFLGNDPKKWESGIHPYYVVNYTKLYDGIDMHVGSQNGNMKYEFIIAPGADPSLIKLNYNGVDGIKIKKGNLVISTSVGQIEELKPYAYQYINNERREVQCSYRLKGNVVSYQFSGDFDHSKPLVIDPTVVFCTFTGSTADNWGFTATYDAQGNFYAGGLVNGLGFPVSTGAFQKTFGGGTTTAGSEYPCDIAIIKFNSTGTNRMFATYIGGSNNEQPHSLIVDSSNNLIIVGRTYSTDYPVTSSAYDKTENGGADLVVTKLKYDGTALLGSTYVGGDSDDVVNFNANEFTFGGLKHNYGDDARSEVEVDRAGNIYVAACTRSDNFPVTSKAYQNSLAGGQDGVVFKLNSNLTSLVWSTYLGGSNDDAAYVLAFDTSQKHLYVGGGTESSDFPTTSGTLYPTYKGGSADGFITEFANDTSYSFERSTFIGSYKYDQVYGIQVDLENSVYAMGQTLGNGFPVTTGVYSNPHSSQFVIKLDSNLTTDIYSTVFGSGDSTATNISPVAFLVDTCQNVYISGWGGNLGLSTTGTGTVDNMPITSSTAIKSTTDGYDFYFIVLSKDATSLLYGSYFGRNSTDKWRGEHVDGGTSRFDKNGIIYQAICGGCFGTGGTASPFPTTADVWSEADSSSNCNLAALKIAFELSAVQAKANASPDAKGCLPFTVHFLDSSINATSYDWNFGDGATDTAKSPTHTFNSAGIFHVRLAIFNPRACKERDTVHLTITVDTTFEHPAFTYNVQDSCGPYVASFTNTSVYSATPGSSSFTKFVWLFGDGTTYSGTTPPTHTFSASGLYTVKLVMIDSTACNSPDTVEQTLRMNSANVYAGFLGPDTVCQGANVTFTDSSTNATTHSWTFGDGGSASAASPSHKYDSVGTYTVTQIVGNPTSCNGADTMTKTITVMQVPTADFTFSPNPPLPNQPISFTNLSTNALYYFWTFGDGDNSLDKDPTHLFRRTGTFDVCLTARNKSACPDKLCRTVSSDIKPLADIPTGFSPNGDGTNDILYVRGAAIETMDLKIYNRWGQMVFESKSLDQGWDGNFNGVPQPMEVYAYVLKVNFIDGTTLLKKGNVTLLR